MSTNEPRQTKSEKQAAARAARQQATQAGQSSADRNKRLWQLGGILVVAAAIIVAIVVATGGGSSSSSGTPSRTPNGVADVTSALDGIPQAGLVAGKPGAPYTFVEYGDLKCPACRGFDVNALPTILKDYVKTGKIKFEFRTLHFLDQLTPGTNDSENAAKYAHAAGLQKKGISFVELWYFNQKSESEVYATPEYLNWLGAAIPGFDTAKATEDAKSKRWDAVLKKDADSAAGFGFNSTPSFLFGPTGGTLAPFQPAGDLSQASSFTTAFDSALGK